MTQVRTNKVGCVLKISSWLFLSSSPGHHHDMNQVSVAVHDLFVRGLGGVLHAACTSRARILLWARVRALRALWHVPKHRTKWKTPTCWFCADLQIWKCCGRMRSRSATAGLAPTGLNSGSSAQHIPSFVKSKGFLTRSREPIFFVRTTIEQV
jgi:hypothetical protein